MCKHISVVFLDVDGVLNTPEYTEQVKKHNPSHRLSDIIMEEKKRLMGDLLDRHPDLHYVASTSWRTEYTTEELEDLIGLELLDSIPHGKVFAYPKSEAIVEWLRKSRYNIVDWVAVDDFYEEINNFRSKDTVLVDKNEGITESKIEEIESKLGYGR